ncbi:hypothetical protein [Lysobacter antibioticus]|uniref:hypothetical protein n=1 Tax=Lysobacter antibioticus TaxID=84531 RepID=UPI001187312A|nr:hypothetical protein [Lysobacter antibioticus]
MTVSGSAAATGTKCFDNVSVVRVMLGQVASNGRQGDSGQAVYIELSDGMIIPFDRAYNLDSDKGRMMASAVLMALTTGARVRGYDHYGTRCDDVQEIQVYYGG